MPPQQPIEQNMAQQMMPKNNKNPIIIILLIVLIALVAYFAFFKKDTNDSAVMNDDSAMFPTGQTQTNQNPTGADYQPNQQTNQNNGNTTQGQQTTQVTYKTFTSPRKISFKYDNRATVTPQEGAGGVYYVVGFGDDVGIQSRVYYYSDISTVPNGMMCQNLTTHTQIFGVKKYTYCDSNADPERIYILDQGNEGNGVIIITVGNNSSYNEYIDLSSVVSLL